MYIKILVKYVLVNQIHSRLLIFDVVHIQYNTLTLINGSHTLKDPSNQKSPLLQEYYHSPALFGIRVVIFEKVITAKRSPKVSVFCFTNSSRWHVMWMWCTQLADISSLKLRVPTAEVSCRRCSGGIIFVVYVVGRRMGSIIRIISSNN